MELENRIVTIPTTICPCCGHILNNLGTFSNADAPKSGDPLVCIECTEVLVFDPPLTLHRMTVAEWQAMSSELRSEIHGVRQHIRRFGPYRAH